MMIMIFVLSGLFLAVLGYGIFNSIKRLNELEQLKAEREARKYCNANMTPVV